MHLIHFKEGVLIQLIITDTAGWTAAVIPENQHSVFGIIAGITPLYKIRQRFSITHRPVLNCVQLDKLSVLNGVSSKFTAGYFAVPLSGTSGFHKNPDIFARLGFNDLIQVT